MKKVFAIILILFVFIVMVSCSSNTAGKNNTTTAAATKASTPDMQSILNKLGMNGIEVYDQYRNIVEIGDFHDNIAYFIIHDDDGKTHFGTVIWGGTYYYGYIDVTGKIIIPPVYEYRPNTENAQDFDYNYVKVVDEDKIEHIIDRKGKSHFTTGQNNVSAIGKVSQGYFWVETVNEQLQGNTYNVTYYSANNLQKIISIDNIQAVYDKRLIGERQSTLNDIGTGILIYKEKNLFYDDDIKEINIRDYVSDYKTNTDTWNVEFQNIPDFYGFHGEYRISGDNNTGGQLATVVIYGTDDWYYSIVDSKGKVLLKPQKDIIFSDMELCEFCNDLCPAQDSGSNYWGYIDMNGKWVIQPQYTSCSKFTSDGYAVVNDIVVIDTTGNVVISPAWLDDETAK